MEELHWIQTAALQQRTPVIIQLTQHDIDSLKTNNNNELNNNNNNNQPVNNPLNLSPYTAPSKETPISQLIQTTLTVHSTDYDGIGLPLTNPTWRARWESLCIDSPSNNALDASAEAPELWRRNGHFFSNELNLHQPFEANKTLCFAAQWLELDATVEGIRFDCELALRQELSYASYLSASHLVLPPIRTRANVADYGRAICSLLNGLSSTVVLSIITPITDVEKGFEAWEDWDVLRKLCGYHPRLNLTLELSQFKGGVDVSGMINRWASEPVGFISIPASTFISNAKQYPVLSKSCQSFVKSMLKFKPSLILSQTLEGKHSSGGPLAYVQYLRYLEKKLAEAPSDPIENFASGYLDYLQAPLQPLADNLDSAVYEGFEKDPVKYSKYEEAIYQALCDRRSDVPQVLAVCGAGRGPLVEAALRASRRANQRISITAIEKNPNSYLTLQERLKNEWDATVVRLWYGDMREYQPEEPVDMLISELLGSFGDNELSPECLDGVMRWLATDGVSIPASYTAFLAPLASTTIYSKVIQAARFQTPFVVMIHAANIISCNSPNADKVQEAWSFDHPRTDLVYSRVTGVPITNFHNARSSHLTFEIPQASICHGLAGYFRATLYRSVTIETHPETRMSREMLSWFPIFFPFKEPMFCPKDSEIDVHMWRLMDQVGKRVWYEWCAEGFMRASTGGPKEGAAGEQGVPEAASPAAEKAKAQATDPASANPGLDGPLSLDPTPLPRPQRIRFAATSLHNVLGKESSVSFVKS